MDRAPLPGWVDCELHAHPAAMVLSVEPIEDGDPTEWAVDGSYCVNGHVDGDAPARIAAEDAARSLVDDMAAALGGTVTWNKSEEE